MAPSPSPDPHPDALGRDELEALVELAEGVLGAAFTGSQFELPPVVETPAALRAARGVFVTLTVDGVLNGCIGDVAARRPLDESVTRLALAAAFDDPRLPPLRAEQYERLTIEVSVLSPFVPVDAADRSELIAQLRPHEDGLVIGAGRRSGLFLPAVWRQLADAEEFLDRLWHKAGLPPWVWPDTLATFTTQCAARTRSGSCVRMPPPGAA
jgi:AmmeMemoRadiSam system protein A